MGPRDVADTYEVAEGTVDPVPAQGDVLRNIKSLPDRLKVVLSGSWNGGKSVQGLRFFSYGGSNRGRLWMFCTCLVRMTLHSQSFEAFRLKAGRLSCFPLRSLILSVPNVVSGRY